LHSACVLSYWSYLFLMLSPSNILTGFWSSLCIFFRNKFSILFSFALQADTPGSNIIFKFYGTTVKIAIWQRRDGMGVIHAHVDDNKKRIAKASGFFKGYTWAMEKNNTGTCVCFCVYFLLIFYCTCDFYSFLLFFLCMSILKRERILLQINNTSCWKANLSLLLYFQMCRA